MPLHTRNWTALPNMNEGRYGFNPCRLGRWIYICGNGSKKLEAFSPQKDTFLSLNVELPEQTYCCLNVIDGSLVVYSDNYTSIFAAQESGQLSQRPNHWCRFAESKRPNCQPEAYPRSGHFYILQKGKCLCFRMETGELVKSYE